MSNQSYSSAGKASPGHLTAELFALRNGMKLTHVPYKGNAEAIRGVLSGETQLMFTPTTGALPLIRSGKLKAIGVYLTDRVEELPGVNPLPGFDLKTLPFWYGLLVPAGTPKPVIDRLNAEAVKVVNAPEVKAQLLQLGLEAAPSTPAEFGAYIKSEIASFARLVKLAGVEPQ